MSLFLAVELNEETKQKLYKKQLELKTQCTTGEWEDQGAFHITVKFIGDDNIHEKVIDILKTWEQTFQPQKFEVVAKDFCRFEQGVSWIGVHNSIRLYEAKYQIEECAKKAGNQFRQDDHGGYTPHITMGYKVEEKPELQRIWEGIPVIVDNVTLWGYAPKVQDTYIHNFLYQVKFK